MYILGFQCETVLHTYIENFLDKKVIVVELRFLTRKASSGSEALYVHPHLSGTCPHNALEYNLKLISGSGLI